MEPHERPAAFRSMESTGRARDKASLHTAFGGSRTLRVWAAVTGIPLGTLTGGVRRKGSLEAYLLSRGLGPADCG